MKPSSVIAVGIALLVVGIVIAMVAFFVTIKDPSQEAVETLYFDTLEYDKTVHLESGDYDIWYQSSFFFYGQPWEVEIRDPSDRLIFQSTFLSSTESISVNNKEYKKIGSFTATSAGNYNVSVMVSGTTLYFTPPINVAAGIGMCFGGVGIGVIGGVLVLVGIVLFVVQKPKPPVQYPPQQYPQQQYPPQSPRPPRP